jgi:hypothetical protein
MMPRLLLIQAPMTQLNTPYPATAYLTGFMKTQGVEAAQADLSLGVALRLFSADGLAQVRDALRARAVRLSDQPSPLVVQRFLARADDYIRVIGAAVRFLQGRDPSLAWRIVRRQWLPEGPRFEVLSSLGEAWSQGGEGADPLDMIFGAMGLQDRAKYLASLFLNDIADVVQQGIDPEFGVTRYGERLAGAQPSFEPLRAALDAPPTLIGQWVEALTRDLLTAHAPDLVAISAPFPGNVLGALQIARAVRRLSPQTKTALGGGYVNTELRDLKDPRLFDDIDFLTFDDGERPLLSLLEHLRDPQPEPQLCRTMVRRDGRVAYVHVPSLRDFSHRDTGTPSYAGLPVGDYLSVVEMLNPMHRLWSDGRWNKLTLAHGCYWKKCSFCDISLDYIGRYDPADADLLVDRIVEMQAQTGESGFHFVDEAAPPALLKNLSKRLIERGVSITWWGNVRFEKTFDRELAALMAASGCVAVSGGLEVASDRLLKLMQKGVTVEQVARVTHALTSHGVMVHAYLMYGFPTQTEQETVDALEYVRQLFDADCIQSAFWHRFVATVHSPVGRNPDKFGIRLIEAPSTFARNDVGFIDPTGTDHDALGEGLRKALYNYMHGVGLEDDVRRWFTHKPYPKLPRATVPKSFVRKAIS